jgi:hypothetical protein
LLEKNSASVKDLDTRIAAIRHIDAPRAIYVCSVGQIELTRACAGPPPLKLVVAARSELHHPSVRVTVRHLERTVCKYGDICWKVELGSIRTGNSSLPDRQEQISGRAELENLVYEDVGHP